LLLSVLSGEKGYLCLLYVSIDLEFKRGYGSSLILRG
jgi:hypothetical protein